MRRFNKFPARDCFDIGRAAYNVNDYYHTIIWMEEAQERLRKEMPHETIQLKEILEYLAFSLFKQGNLKRALLLTEQLHKIGIFLLFAGVNYLKI